MRLQDGRYECALCGAVLDIPLVQNPTAVIHAASGEPNMRVLSYNGREIHRCELSPQRTPDQQP
jgi:hypothetical protein